MDTHRCAPIPGVPAKQNPGPARGLLCDRPQGARAWMNSPPTPRGPRAER